MNCFNGRFPNKLMLCSCDRPLSIVCHWFSVNIFTETPEIINWILTKRHSNDTLFVIYNFDMKHYLELIQIPNAP